MNKSLIVLTSMVVFCISLTACSSSVPEQPDRVVEHFIDAVENHKGDTAVSYFSTALVSGLCEDGDFAGAKADPESGIALFASMGVNITQAEMETMTEVQFLSAVFSSPLVAAEIANYETVEIGDAVMDSTTAVVSVTTDGETQEFELVLENGSWKLNTVP